MSEQIVIYGLVDPRDMRIRYIGQTANMEQRFSGHMNDKANTRKTAWLSSLKDDGLEPRMFILDEYNGRNSAYFWENWWILLGRRQGWDLTNGTNPGEWRVEEDFDSIFSDRLADLYKDYEQKCDELNVERIGAAVAKEKLKASREKEKMTMSLDQEKEKNLRNQKVIHTSVSFFAGLGIGVSLFIGTYDLQGSPDISQAGKAMLPLLPYIGLLCSTFGIGALLSWIPIYKYNLPDTISIKSILKSFSIWYQGMNDLERISTVRFLSLPFLFWLMVGGA